MIDYETLRVIWWLLLGVLLAGFVLFYSALAVVDAVLMLKYARKGPDGLGMWPPAAGH